MSADKKHCSWSATDQHGSRHDFGREVGQLFYASDDLIFICDHPNQEGCFRDRHDHPKRMSGETQAGTNLGLGLRDLADSVGQAVDTGKQLASDPVCFHTIAEEATTEAEQALQRCGSLGWGHGARWVGEGCGQAGSEAGGKARRQSACPRLRSSGGP